MKWARRGARWVCSVESQEQCESAKLRTSTCNTGKVSELSRRDRRLLCRVGMSRCIYGRRWPELFFAKRCRASGCSIHWVSPRGTHMHEDIILRRQDLTRESSCAPQLTELA